MLTFKTHVEDFDNYLLALKKELGMGISWERLIKGEAGAILAKAAERTKRAKATSIRKKYTIKARSKKSMPEGHKQKKDAKGRFKKSGRVKGSKTPQNEELVPYVKMNGKNYRTDYYYPEPIWQKMKGELEKKREKKLKRIWSGKATWLLIAIKAGVNTNQFQSISSMRKAINAQGGSYASNEVENGKPIKKTFSYAIQVDNSATCCINKNARGDFALRSAMAGRAGYMRQNLRHGAFDKAKDIAEKYPGIMVD